jgi:hypothetical protein
VSAHVEYHGGASTCSPFRYGVWAVVDGRKLIAWCMTEESAGLLRLAYNAKAGSKPDDLRLQAAILEGSK